jgi:hypothetical protein
LLCHEKYLMMTSTYASCRLPCHSGVPYFL